MRTDSCGLLAAGTALGIALAVFGCVEEEDVADGGADPTDLVAPTIALGNVSAYQGVSGAVEVEVTAEDDVGVTLVELLVDGAVAASSATSPFTLTWDTTAAADGIVTISARAADASGKTGEAAPVAVVVINGGAEVVFDEGATGTISIPADYAGNTELIDQKYHWTSPAGGAARVIGVVTFTPAEGQAEWVMGLDMGSGWCPDSGTVLDSQPDNAVGAEPIVFDSTAVYPASTQIFFHMRPANPMDHLGESLPFELKAFSFE